MHQTIEDFPQIDGEDPNSFAAFTLRNRLPAILDQIVEDYKFKEGIVAKLKQLKHQVLHGKIMHFIESGDDQLHWKNWLTPWMGKTWFEVPFYFAEAYFYRLILDKVDFFSSKVDPYSVQKEQDILNNHDRFYSILIDLADFLKDKPEDDQLIEYLLTLALWGNKSDLSQLQTSRDEKHDIHNNYTLLNDSAKVRELFSKSIGQIDIVVDNSGVELFADLVLATYLLKFHLSETIILHTKAYPTFVSDATTDDVFFLTKALKNHENELVSGLAKKLETYINDQSIQIIDNRFWNAPLHFRSMPKILWQEFNNSDLLILKGDANYRRIFEDRDIPTNTPIGTLADYLPTPTCAIRILKSELMLGMKNEDIYMVNREDPDWKINGKYGMIQMIK